MKLSAEQVVDNWEISAIPAGNESNNAAVVQVLVEQHMELAVHRASTKSCVQAFIALLNSQTWKELNIFQLVNTKPTTACSHDGV